jgi:UDP-3-O-[3-hydroxymyristoyl] glucosamine N-acyltransferase
MGNKLKHPVSASELAKVLGVKIIGDENQFESVSTLSEAKLGDISYSKRKITIEAAGVVLIAPENSIAMNGCCLIANNPRLAFAKALIYLQKNVGFLAKREQADIHPTVQVSPSAVIGKGVIIGANTIIGHHVVIEADVQIGNNCVIKSGTVIGEDGFGFERNDDGIPIRLTHLGSVVIGNNVELGSLNTVCRGTLSDTVIEDYVKTDDHVHIAHNCKIRKGTLLTACVELSGGVEVGEFAWIGPNSSVMQKVSIGSHAFIGIGANVTKNVADGVTVAGNPARPLT